MQTPHIRHVVYFIGYITLINSSRYIQLGRETFIWRDTRDTPVFLGAMRKLHDARDRVEPYLLPIVTSTSMYRRYLLVGL